MEIYEADFIPMKTTKKKPVIVNVIFGLLILTALVFLITRAISWLGQRDDARLLVLVNAENPLESDDEQAFTFIDSDLMVDSRCAAALEEMLDACRLAGNSPLVASAYRTNGEQREQFDKKVAEYLEQGLDRETAEIEAAKSVAPPGCSEHQTGLAVDIVDEDNTVMDETQADNATQQWLMENSWRYGFVLRYPQGKTAITGIVYEPWHYRYVGLSAAEQIYELKICLEEYIDMFYA